MKLKEFEIETWMTNHELNCKYNLTETCVKHMSLYDLQELTGLNIEKDIMNIVNDYGPIVGSDRLKKAILNLYSKGNKDNITIALGAVNANEMVLSELINPKDHVICPIPTYDQLFEIPLQLGGEVTFVKLDRENAWALDIEKIKNSIKENTKAIVLNSPNNPTGNQYNLEAMNKLIEICKENDLYLVCDEIYRGLDVNCPLSFSDLYEKAIVTSSLSKVFSFAGIRLGWIKGPKDFIDKINFRRDYHMISSGPLFDYLATIVLENKDVILDRNRKIVNENKKLLIEFLNNNPHFKATIPSDGPVCLLEYDYDMPSKEFCEKLQNETGVFFAPGACFGEEHSLRFGFTHDASETKKGLEVLTEWLKKEF